MSVHSELRARLAGAGATEPLFVADLTGWYRYNTRRGTVPLPWRDMSLLEIYRSLGLPIWDVVCPWREQIAGLEVADTVEDGVRTLLVETGSGPLLWRWTLSDDGSWRQVTYPLSGPADLPAAVVWARSLSYELDTAGLTEHEACIGLDGLLAIEVPARPLIQLAAGLMGWQRAPQLLAEPAVGLILEALDEHLQELIIALAQLSIGIQLSPDDLDQERIAPELFERYLLTSYQTTMLELAEYRKTLLVRTRGDVTTLVDLLALSGVSGLAAVDAQDGQGSLGNTRARLGEHVGLWGGIPGQILAPEVDQGTFEATIRRVAADAAGCRGVVLGISGGLPLDADLARLQAIPELIRTEQR